MQINKKKNALSTLALLSIALLPSSLAQNTLNPETPKAPALPVVNTGVTGFSGVNLTGTQSSVQRDAAGSTETKLTSVGDGLTWLSGDQQLDLSVKETGVLSLKIISPALDERDYRTPNEYGDEHYEKLPTVTTYTLTDNAGKVVVQKQFSPSDATTTEYDLLSGTTLRSGEYHLDVVTTGKAKNTFGLLLNGKASLSAPYVNLTIHSHEWQNVAYFAAAEHPQPIEIYDTDGSEELSLRLVTATEVKNIQLPSGKVNLDSITVTPPAGVTSILQVAQPFGAKQVSNTIGIKGVKVAPAPIPMPPPDIQLPPAPRPVPPKPVPPNKPVVNTPVAAPTPLNLERQSTVSIDMQSNARGKVVLSHLMPTASTLIDGSVQVDGVKIEKASGYAAENTYSVASDTLFFTLASGKHLISYQIDHKGALSDLNKPLVSRIGDGGTLQALTQGEYQVNAQGYAQSLQQSTSQKLDTEKASGILRYPLEGSVAPFSQTRVEVYFDGDTAPDLLVNGQKVDPKKIGRKEVKSDTGKVTGGHYTYYSVDLAPGANTIQAGTETVNVKAAGPAAKLKVTPLQLSGDGVTPTRLKVEVLDKDGLVANVPSITLSIKGAQPAQHDSQTGVGGYQLPLQRGVGELDLTAQSGGLIDITSPSLKGTAHFALSGSDRGIAIANGSVTIPLSGSWNNNSVWGNNLSASMLDGRATAEVPLAGGMVRLVADSQHVQSIQSVQEPYQQITGDSSTLNQPLLAKGYVAAEYQNDSVKLRYAQSAGTFPLTASTLSNDSFQGNVTKGHYSIIGTAGNVAQGLHSYTAQTLTGILQLKPGVQEGSEVVSISGTKGGTPVTEILTRAMQYSINYTTGTVVLVRLPGNLDPELENPVVNVTYNLEGENPESKLAWGVAARYGSGKFENLQGDTSEKSGLEVIAGVQHDTYTDTTFGVKLRGETQNFAIHALSLFASGSRTQGDAAYRNKERGLSASVSLVNQTGDYAGPNKGSNGFGVQGKIRKQFTQHFAISALGQYLSDTALTSSLTTPTGSVGDTTVAPILNGTYPTAGAGLTQNNIDLTTNPVLTTYESDKPISQLSDRTYGEVMGEYDFTAMNHRFMAGIGLGQGNASGTSLVLQAGSAGRLGVKIRHLQNLSGNESLTTIQGSAPIGDKLNVTATDQIGYDDGHLTHIGSLALGGNYGISQYNVTYELPGYSGEQGRLSSNVGANWTLNKNLDLGSRFTLVFTPVFGVAASLDLRYHTDVLMALLGTDISNDGINGWVYGLRSNMTYSGKHFTVSELGQSVFQSQNQNNTDPNAPLSVSQNGHRYSLGMAYRASTWAVLSTTRYETGALAVIPGFSEQLDGNLSLRSTELKGGIGVTSADWSAYDYNGYLGFNQWFTNRLGLGLKAGFNYAGGEWSPLIGIEGTVVAIPGLGLSLGYNYAPYTGPLTPMDQRGGFYVQAKALLTEQDKKDTDPKLDKNINPNDITPAFNAPDAPLSNSVTQTSTTTNATGNSQTQTTTQVNAPAPTNSPVPLPISVENTIPTTTFTPALPNSK